MHSLESLLALLPRGRAWTRSALSRFHGYYEAIAAEYDRIEGRVADLLRESVPTGADELLEEWTRLTNADECLADEASTEARQQAAAARFVSATPTLGLVRETIEAQGYDPTFLSWAPFRVGRSVVGDALTNDKWQHTLGVQAAPRSAADDASIACLIQALVQSHIRVFFEWVSGTEEELVTETGEALVTETGEALIAVI